jgi:hypothetical protein
MRERLNAFIDRLFPPPPSYTDTLFDAFHRGAAAVSHAGRDAGRMGASSLRSLDRTVDHAQERLAHYGLTPEMIAGLAAPQLRRLQRTAMKTAAHKPAALAGSLFVIGALGVIAYAISRESQQLAAPNVVRSRD